MNKLPERINAMNVVTYDVQNIVESLTESDEEYREVTLEEVMEVVQSWASDDLNANSASLIFQDENGNDLL